MIKRFFMIIILLVLFGAAVVGVMKFNKNEEEKENTEETKEEVAEVDYSAPPEKATDLLDEQKKMDETIEVESAGKYP